MISSVKIGIHFTYVQYYHQVIKQNCDPPGLFKITLLFVKILLGLNRKTLKGLLQSMDFISMTQEIFEFLLR
jgi:hypothetical protein